MSSSQNSNLLVVHIDELLYVNLNLVPWLNDSKNISCRRAYGLKANWKEVID